VRHRELHVGEESALAPLVDVPLSLRVRLGRSGADGVESELLGERCEFPAPHRDSVPA